MSDDVPYHPPHHQDMYCPKCGAGFPVFQSINIYDATYQQENDEDNENNFLGTHYRFCCPSCEYASLIYADPTELREAWEIEHEKNYPNYVYNKIVNAIVCVLDKQKGMQYPTALLDFGDQVVNGASLFWDMYVNLIEDLAENHISKLSYPVKCSLYEKVRVSISLFADDEPMEEMITREIFSRVSDIAEEAYYEYQEE